jgi:hypothetical protein
MRNFDFTIKGGSGQYTDLDKEYNKFLNNTLRNLDDDMIPRWEIYNVIMDELLELDKVKVFEEIKYRLTDNEDVNEVMLDVITRESNASGLLWFMKKRIEDYIDEDFYSRFY